MSYLYSGAFVNQMKMAGRGHIINISSEAERNPIKGLTVYTGANPLPHQ
jgi:NADP-dependent 3-hydroxy acid dehydrogenase YdfG